MQVHLCVNFNPSINRQGPVVFLVSGNYLIQTNNVREGIVICLDGVDYQLDNSLVKTNGSRCHLIFPENYSQKFVTIIAERQPDAS